jgi:hypothetical protein
MPHYLLKNEDFQGLYPVQKLHSPFTMLQIIQVHINSFTKIDLKPYVVSLKLETGRIVLWLKTNGVSGLIKKNMKCSFGFSVREVYSGFVREFSRQNGHFVLTCALEKSAEALQTRIM